MVERAIFMLRRPSRFRKGLADGIRPGAAGVDKRFRTFDEFALLQLEYAISEMEVPVIMRHDDDPFPSSAEVLQQMPVKDLLIVRVLISSPFIKHAKRPIFEKSRHQGQPLPLTLREIHRRERIILDTDLVIHLQGA